MMFTYTNAKDVNIMLPFITSFAQNAKQRIATMKNLYSIFLLMSMKKLNNLMIYYWRTIYLIKRELYNSLKNLNLFYSQRIKMDRTRLKNIFTLAPKVISQSTI